MHIFSRRGKIVKISSLKTKPFKAVTVARHRGHVVYSANPFPFKLQLLEIYSETGNSIKKRRIGDGGGKVCFVVYSVL